MYNVDKDLDLIKNLLEIRFFEEKLLELFSLGKINGTTHTCIGQEEIAVAVMSLLDENDYIFSNHRGHGHYLARFNDMKGLFCEIMGKEGGVNNGVGGSQHINKENYYSTGIQGESLPVSVGVALSLKRKKLNNLSLAFIGDGTWGEGAVYEALNMCSLWNLPVVVICENNDISQSTPSFKNLSSNIKKRAEAFEIEFVQISEDCDVNNIISLLTPKFENVRKNNSPLIVEVKSKRLASHSKGDDTRSNDVVNQLKKRDWFYKLSNSKNQKFNDLCIKLKENVDKLVEEVDSLDFAEKKFIEFEKKFTLIENKSAIDSSQKVLDNLNSSLELIMDYDDKTYIIGEDIEDPYGGAFKVTKGIHSKYPDRVISTPISELGIAGLGNGLALDHNRSIVEFMFADFTFLAFDQIINFAAKTVSMYGFKKLHKILFRCPYGGHRGYGPTHSQAIHKFLMGVPNLNIYEISPLHDLNKLLFSIIDFGIPSILLESKILYPRKMINLGKYDVFSHEKIDELTSRMFIDNHCDAVILAGGGYVYDCLDVIKDLFINYELSIHLINPFKIYPFNLDLLENYIEQDRKIIIVDESTPGASWSSEIISQLVLNYPNKKLEFISICSKDEIIPSSRHLEYDMLLNKEKIYERIIKLFDYE